MQIERCHVSRNSLPNLPKKAKKGNPMIIQIHWCECMSEAFISPSLLFSVQSPMWPLSSCAIALCQSRLISLAPFLLVLLFSPRFALFSSFCSFASSRSLCLSCFISLSVSLFRVHAHSLLVHVLFVDFSLSLHQHKDSDEGQGSDASGHDHHSDITPVRDSETENIVSVSSSFQENSKNIVTRKLFTSVVGVLVWIWAGMGCSTGAPDATWQKWPALFVSLVTLHYFWFICLLLCVLKMSQESCNQGGAEGRDSAGAGGAGGIRT